jgi:hypothetical protein
MIDAQGVTPFTCLQSCLSVSLVLSAQWDLEEEYSYGHSETSHISFQVCLHKLLKEVRFPEVEVLGISSLLFLFSMCFQNWHYHRFCQKAVFNIAAI